MMRFELAMRGLDGLGGWTRKPKHARAGIKGSAVHGDGGVHGLL